MPGRLPVVLDADERDEAGDVLPVLEEHPAFARHKHLSRSRLSETACSVSFT
jgi:hypothetical protein